jgi:glutamate-1-semialdehyde 2,1-aminomutase
VDTTTSAALFDRARRVIPGGVNSPVRAFTGVGGTPRFMRVGEGAHLVDADGNRYVDLVNSWGPLPLGHVNERVFAAAVRALGHGSSFGAPTEAEVLLAEELVAAVPSIEKVRLVSSGTEAAMSAIRLARGATGRTKLLKFAGHYHGHSDSLLVQAGSGVATLGIPGTPGVTPGTAADTIVVAWNDRAAVEAVVAEHGHDLAVIACEPVAANMNLVPPRDGFLQFLREQADACGALLLFDEVITGFRMGRAGAQGFHGVTPDVTALGKAIGGGFPMAAFGGRAEVMDHLAPDGPVYQAGTLSGNPVAVAAGLAQLAQLDDGVYECLEGATARLVRGFRAAFDAAGVPALVRQHGTLAGIMFPTEDVPFGAAEDGWDGGPDAYDAVAATDTDRYGRFFHAMLERGVYLAPSAYEIVFSSVALDEATLRHVEDAAGEAAATLV